MSIPIPSEKTGQTKVWRVLDGGTSPATINAGSPGDWTTVAAGSLPVGLSGHGPVRDQSGNRLETSAAAKWYPAADQTVEMVTFDGRKPIASNPTSGMLAFWFNTPGRFAGGALQRMHAIYHDVDPTNLWCVAELALGSIDGEPYFQCTQNGQTVDLPYRITPWKTYLAWFAFDATDMELWIQPGALETPVRVSRGPRDGGVGDTVGGLRLYIQGNAFQPPFHGRLGPITFYTTTTLAVARTGPGGMLWPDQGTGYGSYALNASTGSDAAIAGPWQTWPRLEQAVDDCVVYGRDKPFQLGGTAVGWEDLPGYEAKDAFGREAEAGNVEARGDRVAVATGYYYPDVGWNYPSPGVKVTFASGAVLSAARILADNWSQPNVGSYPKMWRYDGSVGTANSGSNRCVWTNSGKCFRPVFGANLAAVQANLYLYDYQVFTTSTGTTYITLPTGTTPSTDAPYWGTGDNPASSWDGMMVVDVYGKYWTEYEFQATTTNQVTQTNLLEMRFSSDSHITIFVRPTVENYGRKLTSFVFEANGLCCIITPTILKGPPAEIVFGIGVNDQAWVGFTDQGDAVSTAANPGQVVTRYYQIVPPGDQGLQVAGSIDGGPFHGGVCPDYISHSGISDTAKYIGRTTFIDPPEGVLALAGIVYPYTSATYTTFDSHVQLVVEISPTPPVPPVPPSPPTTPPSFSGTWYAHPASESDLDSQTFYMNQDTLTMGMDFESIPEVRDGETITGCVVTQEGDFVSVDDYDHDDTTAWVVLTRISAGTATVTFSVTLSGGDAYVRNAAMVVSV